MYNEWVVTHVSSGRYSDDREMEASWTDDDYPRR